MYTGQFENLKEEKHFSRNPCTQLLAKLLMDLSYNYLCCTLKSVYLGLNGLAPKAEDQFIVLAAILFTQRSVLSRNTLVSGINYQNKFLQPTD